VDRTRKEAAKDGVNPAPEPRRLPSAVHNSGNTYGLSLSADGGSIFTHVNGRFAPDRKSIGYGRSSIFHIHLPASEREE